MSLHMDLGNMEKAMEIARKCRDLKGYKDELSEEGKTGLQEVATGMPTSDQHYEYLRLIAQILLQSGVEVNAKDKEGKTALHYAAMSGRVYMAKMLIDAGADVTIKDNQGKTPRDHCYELYNDHAYIHFRHGLDNPTDESLWTAALQEENDDRLRRAKEHEEIFATGL